MSYLSQSSYRRQQPQKSGRFVGIAVVIVLHVGVIYALMSGLARGVVQAITDPIKTEIIEEVAPPPEETPPPPPPPKFDTPPPPFIPPPEIQISQPPPPSSTAIQTTTAERPPVVQPPGQRPAPAAAPAGPTGGGLDRASFVKNPPDYPEQSKRLEEEGVVVIQMYCNDDGRVSEAKLVKSSGFERLDAAALKQAARGRWKCNPPTFDGKPVAGWISTPQPYRFQLTDEKR